MSSSILYKFRSGTTFEALPLPGSAARLLDVKKAIVQAKKLDQGGSMEFDLAVRDATTNAEYTDDAMLLPRGARLVVQRLPAARGHGLLAKIARMQYGGAPVPGAATSNVVPNNHYTIESRGQDDQDEFVSSSTAAAAQQQADKELAALRAATEVAHAVRTSAPAAGGRGGPGGYRPPPGAGRGVGGSQHPQAVPRQRPNADPELRDQEKQPRKKATGIPRTFLNLSKPPDGAEGDSAPLLQPNAIGFEELVQRRGGLSESAAGSKRDLDYALKLTATTIPEYLQCAICEGVVRDAMILPWDPEGRTTCETCIRDALTQNGFRCPLTGLEASPDDLLPNHALRKAAEQFVKKVMEQMDEIEKQQVEEDKPALEMAEDGTTSKPNAAALLDGDGADKGVILSKRASIAEKRRKQLDEDPFGEDDFGGDVFAVETPKPAKDEEETKGTTEEAVEKDKGRESEEAPAKDDSPKESNSKPNIPEDEAAVAKEKDETQQNEPLVESPVPPPPPPPPKIEVAKAPSPPADNPNNLRSPSDRRDRRRQLPAGYTMGPAGGAVGGPRAGSHSYSPRGDGGGRGGGRFVGGGRYQDRTPRHEGATPHAGHEDVSRQKVCFVVLSRCF